MAAIKKNLLFLIKISIFAVAIRILFAFAYYFYYIRVAKMPLYSFDGETYSITAWYIALLLKGVNVLALPAQYVPVDCWVNDRLHVIIASFSGQLPPFSSYGVGPYAYLLGAFYYVFGYAPMLFRILNIFIGVFEAFICYSLAKRIFNERTAKTTFVIMLILPYQFFYSASLQRDTIVNFLCAITVFSIMAIKRSDGLLTKAVFIIVLCSFSLILYVLRFGAYYMMLLSLVFYIIVLICHRFRALSSVALILFFSIPITRIKIFYICKATMLHALTYHIGMASCGGWIYKLFPVDYYIFHNPDIWPTMASLSVKEIVRTTLVSLKSFIVEPFFFSGMTGQRLFALPEMIIWYAILIYAFIGMAFSFKKFCLRQIGLLIFLLVFSLFISMAGANMDALIRHRGMIIFVYVIFAAYGITMVDNIIPKKQQGFGKGSKRIGRI